VCLWHTLCTRLGLHSSTVCSNQPNAHNNRSPGVSLRAQLLRHRYFGILATVQGGLHSAVAIFGVLHGPRDGFRTKQRRRLSFQEAVVVFFEPRVLV